MRMVRNRFPGSFVIVLTDGRRAARHRCLGALVEVIDGHSAAEWQLKVRVRIDAARNDEPALSVDDANAARYDKVGAGSDVPGMSSLL